MPQTDSDSEKMVIEALIKIGIEPSEIYGLFVEIQSAAGRNVIVKIEGLQAKFEAFQQVVMARFSSQDEKFKALEDKIVEALEASARRKKWFLAMLSVLVGAFAATVGAIVVKALFA